MYSHIIEHNQFEHWRTLGLSPQTEFYDGEDYLKLFVKYPIPELNIIGRARFHPDDVDQKIDGIVESCRTRRNPMTWFTSPSTTPADLGVYLEKHGLLNINNLPGMCLELSQSDVAQYPPPELRIEQIRSRDGFHKWLVPFMSGFRYPKSVRSFFLDMATFLGFGQNTLLKHFVLIENDSPMACMSVFLGPQACSIHNLATVSQARRQGLATILVRSVLKQLHTSGFSQAVCVALPQSIGLFKRLGFEIQCEVGVFLWTN